MNDLSKFIKKLLCALIPIVAINLLFAGVLCCLSASEDLTHVSYASAFDKEQRLKDTEGSPRIIIIGGSNARFSFHSPILERETRMSVTNMGIHVGLGLEYMLEEVKPFLKSGDVLVLSAEYEHYLSMNTYRGDEARTDMYLIRQEWGKAFRHIFDTHNYFSLYSLARKRIKRISMNPEDFPEDLEVRTKYNSYGDYTGHYELASKEWKAKAMPAQEANAKVLEEICRTKAELEDRNIKVLFLPPPYGQATYDINASTIKQVAGQLEEAGCGFIAEPETCVYPDSMFYDSSYHLNKVGGQLHSSKIANALKEYIKTS